MKRLPVFPFGLYGYIRSSDALFSCKTRYNGERGSSFCGIFGFGPTSVPASLGGVRLDNNAAPLIGGRAGAVGISVVMVCCCPLRPFRYGRAMYVGEVGLCSTIQMQGKMSFRVVAVGRRDTMVRQVQHPVRMELLR